MASCRIKIRNNFTFTFNGITVLRYFLKVQLLLPEASSKTGPIFLSVNVLNPAPVAGEFS
jgi:hypothetical protein